MTVNNKEPPARYNALISNKDSRKSRLDSRFCFTGMKFGRSRAGGVDRKEITMDAIQTVFKGTPYRSPSRLRLATLVVALLSMLPAAASANWWCSWFPWWFGCGEVAAGCGAGLTEVPAFGSNPGNLTMCKHVPNGLAESRPLVVALHGCTQQASDYDDETGWVKFADKHQFALLLPQQQPANNGNKCFNWFELGDIQRDHGEALSIRQMIDHMKEHASIDVGRIYVTGLSAGGGMTAMMLATYPELFAGGAIIAGIPYRCATNLSQALGECGVSLSGLITGIKDLSPGAWGDLVRNASGHNGPFPRVSIWQGGADTTVNPKGQIELLDQWTSVHGIDQTPDEEDTFNGRTHQLYKDNAGETRVEAVMISGMGHGTPIDPGAGDDQCGSAAPFILNVGTCSSFHIVKFWGLDSL